MMSKAMSAWSSPGLATATEYPMPVAYPLQWWFRVVFAIVLESRSIVPHAQSRSYRLLGWAHRFHRRRRTNLLEALSKIKALALVRVLISKVSEVKEIVMLKIRKHGVFTRRSTDKNLWRWFQDRELARRLGVEPAFDICGV